MPPITIVQGGQYGSEAKGMIAGYLCRKDNIDFNVRTGATNAGHTVFYRGMAYKMQQLGCGWVNPDTTLVIGPGALIDPEILTREIAMVSTATGRDVRKRLVIDPRAGLHTPIHAARSTASGRHYSIGATGKGCSEALVDRIKGRGSEYQLFGDSPHSVARDYRIADTERILNRAYDEGAAILLEGCQGQLLDLYLGPYPYTTHKQTGPAQWLLEAGLSPALDTEIVMVIRTFPIRVAGNSGPLPNEISWEILAGEINAKRKAKGLPVIVVEAALDEWREALRGASHKFPIPQGRTVFDQHRWSDHERKAYSPALSELNATAWASLPTPTQTLLSALFELTTVTKKLRRIARFDTVGFQDAIRQIRPKYLAVTFANYLEPDNWFKTPDVVKSAIIGVPAHILSYGPDERHIVDLRPRAVATSGRPMTGVTDDASSS